MQLTMFRIKNSRPNAGLIIFFLILKNSNFSLRNFRNTEIEQLLQLILTLNLLAKIKAGTDNNGGLKIIENEGCQSHQIVE